MWFTGTHHQHHGLMDISIKELFVLSEPLERGVCVPVASSQLLLFGIHHVVHVVELFLQHWQLKEINTNQHEAHSEFSIYYVESSIMLNHQKDSV